MLIYIANLFPNVPVMNVLSYTSTRVLLGFLLAFVFSILTGRRVIRWLFLNGYRDYPRDFENFSAGSKQGTPTMGGVLIAMSALISILVCADLSEIRVWLVVLSMTIFGGLGWYDDRAKSIYKDADKGASRIVKIIPQVLFGILLGVIAWQNWWNLFPSEGNQSFGDSIYLPFFKEPIIHIGALMPIFGIMWSGGISNAVNYTDGLDGLLSVPAFFCFLVLGVFAFVMGNATIADYLFYPYLFGAEEISVICAIFMGCALGFLWFNTYPAEVFMGDLGALMLGGVLMTISFLLHKEAVFLIVGGIFIFQFFSSVVQEQFLKRKGQRLFRAAPFHEGLTKNHKISEPKVVIRFWIIASMLAAFALLTMKIR